MSADPDSTIPPPTSSMVVKANGVLTRKVFDWFVSQYLPAYEARVTSTYRTQEHNAEIGGAENSAHVHNLAVDFVLYRGGIPLSREEAKGIFGTYVDPYWPGFALFEVSPSAKPAGYHIHVNLPRRTGLYIGGALLAGTGFSVWKLINWLRKK